MLVPNFNHGFLEEQWDALVSSSPNVRLRLIIASLYFDAAMIRVSVKEDQLLAMVVNVERPELEAKKSDLVRKQNEFQVQLAQLEEKLLNALSEADPETILDNRQLIESLDNTKKKATEIGIQRENAYETEAQINLQREIYRDVAAEGSMLYLYVYSSPLE